MSDKQSAVVDPKHTDIEIEALCATLDPAEKPELIDFGPPVGSEIGECWEGGPAIITTAAISNSEIPSKNR